MLYVWDAPLARATKDLDFLGRLDNSLENLERVVRDVCTADVEPDGVVFDPATVKTERIKEDADYEGVRVRFVGLLGKARVAMQLDVGFGDVVTPSAETITYPTLLDFPAPEQPSTLAQWTAFRSKLPNTDCPVRLSETVSFLAEFLLPIVRACASNETFDQRWSPGGPWTARP